MFTITFPLSNENIDHYVGLVRETGQKKKAERKMLTAVCLTLEEILLNNQTRFGPEQKVRLRLKKRSNRLLILVELSGETYNPLKAEEGALGAFVVSELDLRPWYSYTGGVNRVTLNLIIDEGKRELTAIFLSLVLGIGLGLLGKLLPESVLALSQVVVDAVSSAVFGLMKMAAMPVIFLCVVYGILGTGDIRVFRESGLRVLGKLLLSVLSMLLFVSLVSVIVFGIRPVSADTDVSSFTTLVSTIFSVIPDNIFAPFMNGDNVKIIVLGVIFGCALLALGEKSDLVVDLSRQLKDVCSLVMVWVGRLIPLLIVTVLINLVWSGKFDRTLLQLWKIIAVYFGCALLFLLAKIIRVSRIRKIPVSEVVNAVMIPGVKGLVSGSSIFCYSDMEDGLRNKLHMPESTTGFGLPIGFAFYQPLGGLFGVIMLYYAGVSGLTVDAGWLVSYLLLCFITSMAAPPVSGSTISLLAVLFTSLGITDPGTALVFPLYMLLDYPQTSSRVMLLMLDLAKEKSEEASQF